MLSKTHAIKISRAGLQYRSNISTYYMAVATDHKRAMRNHNHILQYRGDNLSNHRIYLRFCQSFYLYRRDFLRDCKAAFPIRKNILQYHTGAA